MQRTRLLEKHIECRVDRTAAVFQVSHQEVSHGLPY